MSTAPAGPAARGGRSRDLVVVAEQRRPEEDAEDEAGGEVGDEAEGTGHRLVVRTAETWRPGRAFVLRPAWLRAQGREEGRRREGRRRFGPAEAMGGPKVRAGKGHWEGIHSRRTCGSTKRSRGVVMSPNPWLKVGGDVVYVASVRDGRSRKRRRNVER